LSKQQGKPDLLRYDMDISKLKSSLIRAMLAERMPISLTYGLLAYYPFNGNAEDESGNGNHGLVNGGAVLSVDRFGRSDTAYSFNGVDSFIEVSRLPESFTGDFSISYWEKSFQQNRMHALSLGETDSNNLDFDFNDPPYGLWVYWNGGGGNRVWTEMVSGGGFTDGGWHHILLRRSGSHIELHVDGVLMGAAKYAGTIGSRGPLRIGKGSCWAFWWNGLLDDVRLYNRALSDAEIATLSFVSNKNLTKY